MKFKKGEKAEVILNKSGHQFKIGEIVEVVYPDQYANNGKGDYKCSNGKDYWYLTDEELKNTK